MRTISFDLETYLLRPGLLMPKMVCLSAAENGQKPILVLRDEGLSFFRSIVDHVTLVGQNVSFDLGVLCAEDESLIPSVFRAVREGRVKDTMIRQKILDNANGELKYEWDEEEQTFKQSNFSLQNLVYRHLKKFIPKGADTWRLRYSELDGVPVAQWPEAAVKYAIGDAVDTLGVYEAQQALLDGDAIPGETDTMRAAWALHLGGAWGIRTDPEMVRVLKAEIEEEYTDAVKRATKYKLVRENGKRDMKAIRDAVLKHYKAHDLEIPLTEKGQVSTDRDTLNNGRYPSIPKDPGLTSVSDVVRLQKLLKTYVVALERGATVPVTPSYNVMVESFRTSCSGGGKSSSGTNIQNPPKKGGVRECFIARPKKVFVFGDYSTLELCTLAQSCLDIKAVGYSRMAEVLRLGKDLHVDMASSILSISYDEANRLYESGDEQARNLAKVVNFGAPGGLGAKTFVEYARAAGITIDFATSEKLLRLYKQHWPEMEDYFRYCSSLCDDGGEARYVVHPRTGYVRGRVTYTATANHHFQHLAAVGAKDAYSCVTDECFLEKKSPLYGGRAPFFVHDEIGVEIPFLSYQQVNDAGERLREIMVTRMKHWCPDVPIKTEPVCMFRWFKGAKPVKVNGMLHPGKPEKYHDEKGKEKTRWVPDLLEDQRAVA